MVRIIAAIDQKRGIAKDGAQPWNLPADGYYFRDQTSKHGGIVLMGRKTYPAIGHPLKNRRNYVLSRQSGLQLPSAEVVNDLENFITNLKTDLWIIGGASVYEQTLAWVGELYLTRIEADFTCDQFFPQYQSRFKLAHASQPQQENGLRFTYQIWKPKRQH